jgi:tRNA C32,U32 (ribose-2'-O)-methylase TrmJ
MENKKLDDSLFEDVKYDDSLFEDVKYDDSLFDDSLPAPLPQVPQQPQSSSDSIVDEILPSIAGVGGYVATKKAQDYVLDKASPTIDKGINKLIGMVGGLSSEQVGKIRQSPQQYKKARTFKDIAEELADTTQDIKTKGYEAAKAGDELISSKGVKLSKPLIYENLGSSVTDFTYDLQKGIPSNIPDEILKYNPELKSKAVPENIRKTLQAEVDFLSPLKDLEGKQLTNYLKDVSGRANFNKTQNLQDLDKVLRDYRELLRTDIAEKDPKFAELKTASAESIKEQKALKKIASIAENPLTSEFESTAKTEKKLRKLASDANLNSAELDTLETVLKKYGKDDLIKEADLAVIKDIVERRGISINPEKLTRSGVLGSTVEYLSKIPDIGAVTSTVDAVREGVGTKAQELLALASKSPLTKAAGRIVGRAMPAVGAGMAYAGAKEANASEAEAVTDAAFSLGTDLLGSVGIAADIAYGVGKELARATRPEQKGPIIVNPDLPAYSGKSKEEQYKEISSKFIESSDEDLAKVVTQIENDESLKPFTNVLDKALTAPTDRRKSILFGLSQQPAFRELLKRSKSGE